MGCTKDVSQVSTCKCKILAHCHKGNRVRPGDAYRDCIHGHVRRRQRSFPEAIFSAMLPIGMDTNQAERQPSHRFSNAAKHVAQVMYAQIHAAQRHQKNQRHCRQDDVYSRAPCRNFGYHHRRQDAIKQRCTGRMAAGKTEARHHKKRMVETWTRRECAKPWDHAASEIKGSFGAAASEYHR